MNTIIIVISLLCVYLIYTYFIKEISTKENFFTKTPFTLNGFMIDNEDFCRTKGFDPCADIGYNTQNIEECRTKGFEICKRDYELGENNSYVANNPIECRSKGVEPCNDDRYLYKNYNECKTKGFGNKPCLDARFSSLMDPNYCKTIGYNICNNDVYFWNNLDYCKANFDVCSNDEYAARNIAECKLKNPNKDWCMVTTDVGYLPYMNACPAECLTAQRCNLYPDVAFNNKVLCSALTGKDYSNAPSVEELVKKGIM
jgi:hypothetical protein